MQLDLLHFFNPFLDPRHKIEGFDVTVWGKDLKDCSISKFEYIYRSNYYLENSNEAANITQHQNILKDDPKDKDLIDINAVYLHKKIFTVSQKTEINNYLQAPKKCADINILEWWKNQVHIYPILSKMARDF